MKSLNILIISSRPIDHSANMGRDHFEALTNAGHHVDFNYPEMDDDILKAKHDAIKRPQWYRLFIKFHIVGILNRLGFYFKIQRKNLLVRKTWRTGNGDEKHPILDPKIILNRIYDKKYDIIYTQFWENIISSETLKVLYDYFKCPIIIGSVDMAPMTGGCYYFGNCKEYSNECKRCPLFRNSILQYAHKNFLTKKKNYNSIELVYACNTYMKSFAEKTGLFKCIMTKSALISDKTFYPQSRESCLKELGIDRNKKFIILARYSPQPRKGFDVAKNSLLYLYNNIPKEESNNILFIIVGCDHEINTNDYPVDILNIGFLDSSTLAKVYSVSNVFLCPSSDDAGPSMVNQSMKCGTPVISFNSGTAIDVVEDGLSGFKVNKGDTEAFAHCLYKLYCLSSSQYISLRRTTHQIAMKWNSAESHVKFVENCYKHFRQT